MAKDVRILVEVGPKGKKVAALAPDWPGLARGGRNPEVAVDRLISYLPRYAPVAELAGFGDDFRTITEAGTIETYPGTPSTDFWGISFASSPFDREPMTVDDLERDLTILQAAWTFFDQVRERVSAELLPGPRGSLKTRDQIVRHTIAAEYDMRKGVGIAPPESVDIDPAAIRSGREDYLAAIREYHAVGKLAGKTPLRHLIRHTAFHTLDHAWEMEDKNRTPG